MPTVRWPAWPGWLVTLAGFIVAGTSLVATAMVDTGTMEAADPDIFLWAAGAGAAAVILGFVYHAVRAILTRRHLPAGRYRGPSVIVLLALAFVLANLAVAPFTNEALTLLTGSGEIGTGPAAVILTSTQLALLATVGLFVAWPRALAGSPPIDGGSRGGSIGRGLGYGIVAWFVATLIGAAIALGLGELGVEIQPQAAERALALVDPWLIVLAVVVIAPVAEEIFFRGVVYNAWRREHGRTRALFGSSVLFAVIHPSLVALVPIFLVGLGLAWLYERTRSLLACIVMHATFNGIAVILALLARYDVINFRV